MCLLSAIYCSHLYLSKVSILSVHNFPLSLCEWRIFHPLQTDDRAGLPMLPEILWIEEWQTLTDSLHRPLAQCALFWRPNSTKSLNSTFWSLFHPFIFVNSNYQLCLRFSVDSQLDSVFFFECFYSFKSTHHSYQLGYIVSVETILLCFLVSPRNFEPCHFGQDLWKSAPSCVEP